MSVLLCARSLAVYVMVQAPARKASASLGISKESMAVSPFTHVGIIRSEISLRRQRGSRPKPFYVRHQIQH